MSVNADGKGRRRHLPLQPAHTSLQRDFAVQVVTELRDAGHQAVWAGGCVRDMLLGLLPKDYDIATDAKPERVREVFGKRRTLPMGAAFGVITVLGSRQSGHIEVATFRKDAEYSDGRRPDAVHYSSAEEDALRRDFTINGMFYDPIKGELIDYVGGERDIELQVVRAIGRPEDRLSEDKLRMLRAVRFAARLDFAIEPETIDAVRRFAGEIHVVSGERIGAEMRRVLAAPRPGLGLQLLAESGLLSELAPVLAAAPSNGDAAPDPRALAALQTLVKQQPQADFVACFSAAMCSVSARRRQLEEICERWRLSNDERKTAIRIADVAPLVLQATTTPWPELQRILVVDVDHGALALQVARAMAQGDSQQEQAVQWALEQIALPREQWDPSPLIDGQDLKHAGLTPGPEFRRLLQSVRDEQLMGRIADKASALLYVQRQSQG